MDIRIQHDVSSVAPSDRWRQTLVTAWREHRLTTISLQSRQVAFPTLDEEPLRDDDQT